MNLLLDTHTFLWFVLDDERLSKKATKLILDKGNQKFLSFASLWELSIKSSLGKIDLSLPFDQFIDQEVDGHGFHKLGISTAHVKAVNTLEMIHRDPFDRMIIVQSMTEDMPVISKDEHFDSYPIKVIW